MFLDTSSVEGRNRRIYSSTTKVPYKKSIDTKVKNEEKPKAFPLKSGAR